MFLIKKKPVLCLWCFFPICWWRGRENMFFLVILGVLSMGFTAMSSRTGFLQPTMAQTSWEPKWTTQSVPVILQGPLALEYTTTLLTHAQTIHNHCLAFCLKFKLSCCFRGCKMNGHVLRVPSVWRNTCMHRSHACCTALGWPFKTILWFHSSIVGLKQSALSQVCGADNTLPLHTLSSSQLEIINQSHVWFVVRLYYIKVFCYFEC